MELPKEKDTKDPTEKKKSDGKMKSVASIPANYVSILQLQERWVKDKERKHKERDFAESGVKEKNVQGRREEEEARKKLEKMGLGEVSASVRNKDEDAKERRKNWFKKKANKKNQGGSVEEVVKCGSKETQGEKTEDGRDREVNVNVRLNSGQGYYRDQRHDWSSTRVVKATRTMVWVKKGENDAASGGKH